MEQRWFLANKKNKQVEKNLYGNQVAQRVIQGYSEGHLDEDWMVWSAGWTNWKPLTEIAELINEIQILAKIAEEAPPSMDFSLPSLPVENQDQNEFASEDSQQSKVAITDIKPLTIPSTPISPQSENQSHYEESRINEEEPSSGSNLDHKAQPIPPARAHAETIDQRAFTNRRRHPRFKARYRCIIRSSTITFRTFTVDISLGGVALEDPIPRDLLGSECLIYISSSKTKSNLKFKIALTGRAVSKYFSFEDADPLILEELQGWLQSENLSLVA